MSDKKKKEKKKEHEYKEDEGGIAWGDQHQKPSKLVTEMPNYKPSPRPNPIKPRPGMTGPVRYGAGSDFKGPLAGRRALPMPEFDTLEKFHKGSGGMADKVAGDITNRNKRQFEKDYGRIYERTYERDYEE